MNTNEVVHSVFDRFGDKIIEWLGDGPVSLAFFPSVEKYADSFESVDCPEVFKKTTCSFPSTVNVHRYTIVHDFGYTDDRKITEFNKLTIGNKKFIKIVTSFFEERTYDFIITLTEDFDEIYRTLSIKRKEENERVIDFPIIGIDLDELKKQTIDYLLDDKFRSFCEGKNIKLKRGVVFEGPPGNGKSCALSWLKNRAVEKGIEYNVYSDPKTFLDDGYHEAYNNKVKKIFVFEDFDAFLRERTDNDYSPNQILTKILNMLDGIDEIKNIVSIFTTNALNTFDSAFLRPGRIDKIIKFPPPSQENIASFFKAYIPEIEDRAHQFLIENLNKRSAKVSYAVLKGICDEINISYFNNETYPDWSGMDEIITEKCKGGAKGEVRDKESFVL